MHTIVKNGLVEPRLGFSIAKLECTEEFFKKMAFLFCGVADLKTEGPVFQKVLEQLKNVLGHPMFISYDPTYSLYALHPLTHSEIVPDLSGELRRSLELSAIDLTGATRIQYITDIGYYIHPEVWESLVQNQHIKFKLATSSLNIIDYLFHADNANRVQDILEILHAKASDLVKLELGKYYLPETIEPVQFKVRENPYMYFTKTKTACYLKKLL
jgi:hypothetical protein